VTLVVALLVAVLSFQLNASMIAPVLPGMAAALHVDLKTISAVSSWFFLSGAVGGLVLGRWSDHVGRKTVLVCTLGALLLGTFLCALAGHFWVLMAGRVLQGFSSAVFQVSYVIIRNLLTAEAFGIAMGTITAINGGVGGLDGYLAGYLDACFGFRSIFELTFAVALLALVCVLAVVPRDTAHHQRGRMDWGGAVLFALCLIAVTRLLEVGPQAGWASGQSGLCLAAMIVFGTGFASQECRHRDPLVPIRLFVGKRTLPLLVTTILTLSGIFSLVNFTLLVLLQDTHAGFGLSPARSALLILAPTALIGCAAAPCAGWCATRIGWITCLRIGVFGCAAVLAALATGHDRLWLVAGCAAVLGVVYNGLVLTALNGLGVILSAREAEAALPGLNGSAFGIGASLGIVCVAPYGAAGSFAGFGTAIDISLAFMVAACATSLLIGTAPGRAPVHDEG